MNNNVNFEISKLLKDKEFMDKNIYGEVRLSQPKFYDSDGIIHNIKDAFEKTELNLRECYNAPTIAEVVMWLYEKHNIWIYADSHEFGKWCYYYRYNRPHELSPKITENGQFGLDDYNSPTEAYEAAIKHVLEKRI